MLGALHDCGMALFINRPHVAILMFICLARKKLFPVQEIKIVH